MNIMYSALGIYLFSKLEMPLPFDIALASCTFIPFLPFTRIMLLGSRRLIGVFIDCQLFGAQEVDLCRPIYSREKTQGFLFYLTTLYNLSFDLHQFIHS